MTWTNNIPEAAKTYLENNICILYGGRLAEKLIFNEITTGAGNDIERASALARKMVCEWGMSDELGALTYGKKEEQVFLGKEIGQTRDFSEDTARKIDVAVKQIIDTAMNKVWLLLESHRDILDRMSQELLEKETIVLEDMEKMIEELRPGKYTTRMTKLKKEKKKKQSEPESGVASSTTEKQRDEEEIPEADVEVDEAAGSESAAAPNAESGPETEKNE